MLYRLSFRRRIWIAFMLIVIFAVTTAGALSYMIAEEVVKDNAYQLSQETIHKTSKVLDEKLNHVTQAVYSMMVNTAYRRALGMDSSYSETENYYTHLSGLQSTFVQTKLYEPIIDSILIATREGDYYQTSQQRNFSHSFYDSELYTHIKSEKRKLWVAGHEDRFFSSRENVISFVMEGIPSHYIEDNFVVANVKIDSIRSLIASEDKNRKQFHLLASSDGSDVLLNDSIIADTLKLEPKYREALTAEQGSFEYSDKGYEYLVNFTKVGGVKEWTLFSFLPKSELMKQMDSIKLTILGVITGCLLVSFAFANMLTRLLIRPLSHLQSLMKRVEMNDLNVRYESEYNDEITQVGYRFNRMLEELNEMFDVVKQAEKDKRQSEMKALQAQIDPHFLYNTLNTVYWKCQLNQLEDVQEMVLSLSQLFQLGLNRGNEMTTLEHELLHVEQYLNIQQKCYETLFTYNIEVDPLVDMQHPILKIMLQPLVENSILHGFNDRNEGGFIRIQVKQDSTYLYFNVEDNGTGLNEKNPADPLLRQPASSATSGYALNNVRLRLQLQYGSSADLYMESEPHVCTRVSIIIPRYPRHEGS
ncbi:sensor histidine kinase [Paenibacillus lautus]|uniref:cache domain-containing sensor histidine kinase n=1 Tax=Paenibacillus lautus TaxID=1401 RepID=UPI002DBEE4CB|nr:sensor histidine kinase [Paenibacillus lautus]MEC0201335.1 sensor histidine kinase [Paenibacillus lautus]